MGSDRDERATQPPGPEDEACREYELTLVELGENDARFSYLERMAIIAGILGPNK